jgi:predicted ATPase
VVTRARLQQGMTAEQRSAFAYATRAGGKLRVITGVPGAGKTFLIRSSTRTDGASPTTRIIGFSLRNECKAFAISAWRSITNALSRTISRAKKLYSTTLHQMAHQE